MFKFNKSNTVPRSRRSSIDSLVTDPSASTSEAGPSQCSNTSLYGEVPSSEPREQQYPAKRTSVFKLRARSNTTASTTSTIVSISPVMLRPYSSHQSSQDFRHTGQNLLDISGVKRPLFTRGKRGKRLSGTFSPSLEIEENGEVTGSRRRTSVLRKGWKGANQPDDTQHHLKNRISSPFDFQHLTHTDRHQFTALEQASENDLVAEFSAVRASQAPRRDLNGIKADDLHFRNFSSENLARTESRSTSVLGYRSPPLSPEPRNDQQQPESPRSTTSRTIRPSRSVESFSQPGISPRAHRYTQSTATLSRVPSRPTLAPIDALLENPASGQRFPSPPGTWSRRNSGVWDQFTPLATPTLEPSQLPPITHEPDYFAHAVTTPDDTAIHPMTPAYSPELEDVAEEPECFVRPRRAPTPPTRSPKSPRSPYFESITSRTNPRTPIARSNSRGSSYTPPRTTSRQATITRPISQMSDTLGSPIIARRTSTRRPSAARRRSNTWRVIEESWEDDVDYIYDNAMEAECDFDWEHASDDSGFDRDRTPEQRDHERPLTATSQRTQTPSVASEEEPTLQSRFFQDIFRPSLLVPSPSNVPELESHSVVSASTASTGIQTPSDFFSSVDHRAPYNHGEGFIHSPSLLIPQEYKEDSREEMYNDILGDYEGSDRHFPLLDTNQSISGSTRSSHVRSSKRSSYDSSLMSSGQGSGSWSSPVRRSASSSGSLPELVQSRRSRKDFNVVVEKLSEQVASFASFSEDDVEVTDDDTTPPGRPLQDRTFFAAGDEDQQAQNIRESIEGEVKASLELARQGSTRSSRSPFHYHKYASSDGATKLLTTPIPTAPELQPAPNSRKRAASSSSGFRGNKQPYLSLFPTPPKHTPSNTPTSPIPSNRF